MQGNYTETTSLTMRFIRLDAERTAALITKGEVVEALDSTSETNTD